MSRSAPRCPGKSARARILSCPGAKSERAQRAREMHAVAPKAPPCAGQPVATAGRPESGASERFKRDPESHGTRLHYTLIMFRHSPNIARALLSQSHFAPRDHTGHGRADFGRFWCEVRVVVHDFRIACDHTSVVPTAWRVIKRTCRPSGAVSLPLCRPCIDLTMATFSWLQQTTGHRYFPELWTVRTRLGT